MDLSRHRISSCLFIMNALIGVPASIHATRGVCSINQAYNYLWASFNITFMEVIPMKQLIQKINALPTDTKVSIAYSVGMMTLSLVARKSMHKAGMVKSFWYGLPHKPNTFR